MCVHRHAEWRDIVIEPQDNIHLLFIVLYELLRVSYTFFLFYFFVFSSAAGLLIFIIYSFFFYSLRWLFCVGLCVFVNVVCISGLFFFLLFVCVCVFCVNQHEQCWFQQYSLLLFNARVIQFEMQFMHTPCHAHRNIRSHHYTSVIRS